MDEKEENIIENSTQEQNIVNDTPIEVEKQESSSHDESTTAEVLNEDKPSLSIAAMVLGIVSLVFWANWAISIICAILALVFGIIRMKKPAGKGMAIAGFVTGLITLVWWGFIFSFAILGLAVLFSI